MGIMSVQGMRVREMHAWIPSIEQLTLVTKRAYVLIKKKPIWMNEFMKAKQTKTFKCKSSWNRNALKAISPRRYAVPQPVPFIGISLHVDLVAIVFSNRTTN